MRSWNSVTLDQIAPQVVTPLAHQNVRREHWRRPMTPVMMLTAILIISPTSQLQPRASGNYPVLSAPATNFTVERTHRARPAFLDQFKRHFEVDFVTAHETKLNDIAAVGSTRDTPGNAAGVVEALAVFKDEEDWQLTPS